MASRNGIGAEVLGQLDDLQRLYPEVKVKVENGFVSLDLSGLPQNKVEKCRRDSRVIAEYTLSK